MEACASLSELSLNFYDEEVDGYKVGGYKKNRNMLVAMNAPRFSPFFIKSHLLHRVFSIEIIPCPYHKPSYHERNAPRFSSLTKSPPALSISSMAVSFSVGSFFFSMDLMRKSIIDP